MAETLTWDEAIMEARSYVRRWYYIERILQREGAEADKHAEYDRLPSIVKRALQYLTETEEIQ